MVRKTKYKFKIGDKFGKWTILDSNPIWKTGGYVHFLCKCGCGTEREVSGGNLLRKVSTNCGCVRNNEPAVNYKGVGLLSGRYFSQLKRGAISRNLPFEITIEQAHSKFTGRCALTNLEISLVRDCGRLEQTASLDRIDSNLGYVENNIQWVHKDVNVMKRDFPQTLFIDLCKRVAQNN